MKPFVFYGGSQGDVLEYGQKIIADVFGLWDEFA